MKKDILLLLVLILVILLVLHYVANKSDKSVVEKVRIDTVFKVEKVRDTVQIIRTRNITKIKYDTIFVYGDTIEKMLSPSFIIELDTVVRKDTIALKYFFPQDSLLLQLKFHPDTITVFQFKEVEKKKESFKDYLIERGIFFILGVVIGVLL